ncbi:NAD-dependent epimerase/dehydratase family protein, partial [Rhizobium johnstonii]|uniref:NAD-dependent epimerase/dehydratase family protein n=1 Tax=Rhizobium johnstonii TaxID=3019933 RepID=UPI003F96977F
DDLGTHLAGQLRRAGAEVIGVDVREPVGGSAAFIKGDLSTASGVAEIVAKLPVRLDALANVAGLSGNNGVVSTLAVNFYGLRALSEAVVPRLR